MSQLPPDSEPQEDDLQFSSVEPAGAPPGGAPTAVAGPQCVACHQPIVSTYFAAGDKLVCPACRDRYMATLAGGSRSGRLFKATALGIGAGLLGALLWFGVRRISGYDLGIVAVVVGLMVGAAVKAGSGGRGGRGYQFLAVLLTYLAVGVNYAPEFMAPARKVSGDQSTTVNHSSQVSPTAIPKQSTSRSAIAGLNGSPNSEDDRSLAPAGKLVALVLLIVICIVLVVVGPVIVGFSSIIGALIICFALWEAWKINASRRVTLAGPYSLAGGMPGLPPLPGGAAGRP